jgi:RNA polymerase sigma-54 factor
MGRLKTRIGLEQKQKLSQKLSPQQIQYIKLLQLPTLELEQRIKEEMEENPLLEEGPDEEIEQLEDALEGDGELRDDEDEKVQEVSEGDSRDEIMEDEEEFDWDYFLNSANDLYGYKARVDSSGGSGDDHDDIPTPYEQSLIENLEDQLTYLDLGETEEVIARQIIGSIDPDGYFRREFDSVIDDIMFNEGIEVSKEQVEQVLQKVQELDPIGIASRNLQECLLVQLETLPEDTPHRDTAIDLLENHYKAFTMKHFKKLRKRLDLSKEELKDTFELIRSLNPKPGEGDFTASQNYITPDFRVDYVDDEFIISLNGRNAPQLRISRQYRKMLNQMAADKEKEKETGSYNSDAKKFLKNKMESAKWFIDSINQRRHTMMKTMHAIVELQEDFFKYGSGHLKPMILKDVAEIIDMDISTVSRVVNGKYVQTEFGVYELKYFFSEGITMESGEEISNKEVKSLLQDIVNNEDKTSPLSDQKLADELAERGFKIARRTVTKYRKQLGIPVARLRKEIVLDEEAEAS